MVKNKGKLDLDHIVWLLYIKDNQICLFRTPEEAVKWIKEFYKTPLAYHLEPRMVLKYEV